MSFFNFLRSKADIDIDRAEMLEAIRADTSIKITTGAESLEIKQEENKEVPFVEKFTEEEFTAFPPIMQHQLVLQEFNSRREQEKLKRDSHKKLKAILNSPQSIYKKRKPTHQKSASSF